jgi:hypothetical protein
MKRGRGKGEKRRGDMYYVVFTVVVIGATIIAVALFGLLRSDASVKEKRAKRRVGRARKVRAIGKGVCLEIW